MVFSIKSVKNKKIEQFYNNAVNELNEFYTVNWSRNNPKIFLISSREEFNNLFGKKTEDWVVGTTMGSSHNIYLLSPEVYEKESNHKYSDAEYERLLKHEMSHLYTKTFYKNYNPVWFIEGIAIYSSGQLDLKRKVKEFKNFLDFYNKGGSGIYDESGWAVMILDKELGRKKLIQLLKDLNEIEDEEAFSNLIKNTYGIDLSYDWFNKGIEKYL